jgi:hypothetical protein
VFFFVARSELVRTILSFFGHTRIVPSCPGHYQSSSSTRESRLQALLQEKIPVHEHEFLMHPLADRPCRSCHSGQKKLLPRVSSCSGLTERARQLPPLSECGSRGSWSRSARLRRFRTAELVNCARRVVGRPAVGTPPRLPPPNLRAPVVTTIVRTGRWVTGVQ